jgi:pimeloyl-ACP methyl ester carboxylesterase
VINTLEKQWERLSDPWYPDLDQQPAARVERPVILVPGWSTETEVFSPLLSKLEERNPAAVYVKNGQFFSDPGCRESTSPTKETKVYMLVFQDNRATPDRFLAEFQLALSSLPRSGPIDVLGYSLGGSVARDYLDRGGDKVGKLLMLGTPANGTPLVEASVHILRRDIKWASSLAGLKGTDLDALEALAPSSAYFRKLNSGLEEQLSRTEATELAGVGNMWTLSSRGLPRLHGDGLVPLDSLKLPGVPMNRLDGEPAALHEHQPYSVGAYQTMTRFFGWES